MLLWPAAFIRPSGTEVTCWMDVYPATITQMYSPDALVSAKPINTLYICQHDSLLLWLHYSVALQSCTCMFTLNLSYIVVMIASTYIVGRPPCCSLCANCSTDVTSWIINIPCQQADGHHHLDYVQINLSLYKRSFMEYLFFHA